MAAGIGMDSGQREAELISSTSLQVMEALANILKALAVKKDYHFSDMDDKGLKVILGHIRQGGQVRQSIIDEKDAALFERSLRARHIPYAQAEWKEPEGNTKRVYFTRAGSADGVKKNLPNDMRLLEEAWEIFVMQLQKNAERPVQLEEPQEQTEPMYEADQGRTNYKKNRSAIDR